MWPSTSSGAAAALPSSSLSSLSLLMHILNFFFVTTNEPINFLCKNQQEKQKTQLVQGNGFKYEQTIISRSKYTAGQTTKTTHTQLVY